MREFECLQVCIVNISLGSGVVEENIMDVFLDVMVPELNTKRDELSAERSRYEFYVYFGIVDWPSPRKNCTLTGA